jgi:hypothetical protein
MFSILTTLTLINLGWDSLLFNIRIFISKNSSWKINALKLRIYISEKPQNILVIYVLLTKTKLIY